MNFVWDHIRVGDQASFEVVLTDEMASLFIELSGDNNLLHTDESFARQKGFAGRVAQGMMLVSFFSRLVGKNFLGNNNLYVSQSAKFRQPVVVGEKIIVSGVVKGKVESIKTLTIETIIRHNQGEVAVTGEAVVKYI